MPYTLRPSVRCGGSVRVNIREPAPKAASPDVADPLLSVIVTIVEGGPAMRRLLQALTSQSDAPPMEIIVPFDDTVAEHFELRESFPTVRFLALGSVRTEQPSTSAAGEHELFDRRRAAGLSAATGELIAILEDRGAPRRDWARTAVRLHAQLPHAVIGGAIDLLPSGVVGYATHVCDFSRYSSPFSSGSRDWVSDVNVTYKRRAVEQTRALWRERYQEPVVHWSLQQHGDTLYLSNALVVEHQRATVPMAVLLRERFHWGRLFGAIRGRHSSVVKRALLALAGPIVPVIVLARHGRAQVAKGNGLRFVRAVPIILLLLTVWSVGEAVGIVTGRS
jgi:hypothetical protein